MAPRFWESSIAAALAVALSATANYAAVLESAVNPENQHIYYLLSQSNWTDAEAEAVSLGGHLATIRSDSENSWVYSTFTSNVSITRGLWIGFTQAPSGGWQWVSGEPVGFAKWAGGEPTGDGPFAHILWPGDYRAPRWNDMANQSSYSGIPMHGVAEVPPPDCNGNGVEDGEDISSGTSSDCDQNGMPDECQFGPAPADSVSDFSNTQGHNGWHYGIYAIPGDVNSWSELQDFDPTTQWWETTPTQPPWGVIFASGGVPGSYDNGPSQWIVRRWVSPTNGRLTIEGDLSITNIYTSSLNCGDGIIGYIIVDGAVIWQQAIHVADLKGTHYKVGISVHQNSTVDFAVSPGEAPSIPCDWARFTASIRFVTAVAEDCNKNGLSDACDLASGFATDCNENGVPDKCDLASGAASDCNSNGVPDECELAEIVLADSVEGFSSIQGKNGWLYGYYQDLANSSTWTPMQSFNTEQRRWGESSSQPPWTQLWAEGGHPGTDTGSVVHLAVRRWISTVSGRVLISGAIGKDSINCGDGVKGYILIDGKTIFAHDVKYNDGNGFRYNISAEVSLGSAVDFAISPGEANNVQCDGTTFTARIAHVIGSDCNKNGHPDECDIAAGVSFDCDHDGIPDECQMDSVIYSNHFEAEAGNEWSNYKVEVSPKGRRFLGQFSNDNVTLTLNDLPPHSSLTVSFLCVRLTNPIFSLAW